MEEGGDPAMGNASRDHIQIHQDSLFPQRETPIWPNLHRVSNRGI